MRIPNRRADRPRCAAPRRSGLVHGLLATMLAAAWVSASAQQHDPKRPQPHQPRPAQGPSGPINVPTYSPPIGPFPVAPINNAPAAQYPPRGGDHRHPGPILIAPTVGLPVSPTFGSGPIGVGGSHYAYYCPDFGAYYPNVTHCPSAWVIVAAQPEQRWR